ncbi:MAG: hypothetical protein ACOC2L_04385 [Candidatus Sumerlaeota bacterium]
MTTTSRIFRNGLILLLLLAFAGSALAVQPPVPENPLLTKNYQVYGETADGLLHESMVNAVSSGAGQLFFRLICCAPAICSRLTWNATPRRS